MNKTLTELRLKRLRYRSWHRGWKETDLVLGNFADRHLGELKDEQVETYEKMLDANDADIWDWLVGNAAPPDAAFEPILTLLRHYTPVS
jgi:antitoxin CptB